MALAPSAAGAASTVLAHITNWPKVQKVTVTNSSSAPAYTQPPAHTVVNLHGSTQIINAGASSIVSFYTVPVGKWLVITSMNTQGYGPGPIDYVTLESNDASIHETFPILLTSDNGIEHLSSTIGGTSYVPPGTVLELALFRETSGTGIWNAEVWDDGYLTSRP
jgi:hypothetical protein